ncbi:unnamed protein product [Pedinophyceae sp. YPF-701]|nr:unnamed protein product [Pedinophyceae sp. YPF-701]
MASGSRCAGGGRDVRKEADWDEIAAIMAHVRKVGRPPPDDEELPQHPTPRLNHAVRQLGRDGRVMEARELVTWMLRAGRANEHTFAMWFEALGRAGSASEALRGCLALFKAGSRRGGAAAGAGVPGAAPTGPLSVLYDGPPPGVPRVRVGSVAASAAMNAACLDTSVPLEDALDFLAAAKAAGMKLNARTYNAALHRCAIDGNAQEALSVLSVMQLEREIGNVELDTYTYAAVLRALDAGDMAAAVRPVYASMRVDTAAKLLRPDAPLMSHVLHLASLVGEVALAEDVVGDMDAWGIPWTLEVHNALLSVYGRQGNLPAALDWYRRRVVGAGTDPDVRTAVHLCVAAARASASMAAVLLLLDELASDLPRDTRATSPLAGAVLSCIRDAKDHAGPDRNDARGDEILRWYKHARRAGVRLHGPVYRLVVSALASAERVDDAERVFADMSAAGIVPTTTCITTLASAWEWTAHVAGDDAARARAAERAAELRELQGSLVQLHGADVMADDADAGPWEAESGGCSARRLLTGPP